MIVDAILILAAMMVALLVTMFSFVGIVIPDWIEVVMEDAFEYLARLQPIFPMVSNPAADGVWAVAGIYDMLYFAILFIVGIYSIKLIIALLSFMPIIGKKFHLPAWGKHDDGDELAAGIGRLDKRSARKLLMTRNFSKLKKGRGISTKTK